jgi:tyrosinase
VLAMQHDYANVSNDLQPGDNFESVHDTIHNTIGSDGHMSFLAIAAFDPIFWLHHAYVIPDSG